MCRRTFHPLVGRQHNIERAQRFARRHFIEMSGCHTREDGQLSIFERLSAR